MISNYSRLHPFMVVEAQFARFAFIYGRAYSSPLVYGGHQERNRRGGTESVPLIVGMGKSAELARKYLPGYEKCAATHPTFCSTTVRGGRSRRDETWPS